MSTATARKALDKAQDLLQVALAECDPARQPKALAALKEARAQVARAWLLVAEGEDALENKETGH